METKYLLSGVMVNLISTTSDGKFVVEEIYEDGDGDQYPSDTAFVVDHVFDNPPTPLLHEEIVRLNKQIEERQKALDDLNDAISDREQEGKAILAQYAKFAELKELNAFISGKITHVFLMNYDPQIMTFEEAVKVNDKFDKGLKLITLFGRTNGDLRWRLNHYSDGSGSNADVILCTSYEDALKAAQIYVDKEVKDDLEGESPQTSYRVIDLADKYHLKVDPRYRKLYEEEQIKGDEKLLKEKRDQIAKLEDEVDAIIARNTNAEA